MCPFRSRGVVRRLGNIVWAAFQRADVNHITGDVHYLTLGLRKAKTVLTVHDCASMRRLPPWKQRLFRLFWITIPTRRAAMVVFDSQFGKEELLKYVPIGAEKMRVVPIPVNNEFTASPAPFHAQEPRILQVGTAYNKNLERVAMALHHVRCRLEIVGRLSSEQTQMLERLQIPYSVESGLSDSALCDKYKSCDMVVFASTYEGFGMPIVEANAIGRPVVTSNVGSMPEVAGGAACLVDPFDEFSIRAGILRVIGDARYREDLVKRGYANAARFSASAVAARTAELYYELHPRRTRVAVLAGRA
jgi:glycosyltransferase involved in cell wall biosynthesis